MKNLLIFATTLLISIGTSFAQGTIVDSITLSGLPLQVYVQSHTGIPIIAQQYSYVGLDQNSGDSLWSIQRSSLSGLTQKLSEDYEETTDFVDVANTPYVYIRGQFINVRNGNVLIDESAEVKVFRGSQLIKEKELLLVELGAKGAIRLYGFHPSNGEQKFVVNLRKASGLGQALTDSGESDDKVAPVFDDAGRMLYQSGKSLALVDTKAGNLVWSQKLNTAKVERLDNNTKLLVVEKPTGLGLGSLSNTSGMGKMMHLLNYETGKAIWPKGLKMGGNLRFFQEYDGGLLVAHDDGVNILDYRADGDGRWKKDFKQGGIHKVTEEQGGLMVYFRAKRMLIDPSNGEEKWKKDEKVGRPKTETNTEGLYSFNFGGKDLYFSSSNGINMGQQRIGFNRIAFDEANQKMFTARFNREKVDIKREKYTYFISAYDLAKGTVATTEVAIPYGIEKMDVNDNGDLFMFNKQGFSLYALESGELVEKKSLTYDKIKRKGAKTGKRIAKLLGSEEEEEVIPSYLVVDRKLEKGLQREDFDPMAFGRMDLKVNPILGGKNLGIPYLSVIDKNTGEIVVEDLLIFDNTNFTLDEKNGIVYVIHGKTVRWYSLK